MTIPVSSIVDVAISIGATYPQRRGFGILNCVTAETGVIGTAERIRFYQGLDAVSADWSGTEVEKLATSYYSQQPRPINFAVSLRVDSATPAEVRGGSVPDTVDSLTLFTSITDGSFVISIDGDSQDVTGMSFAAVSSLVEVAGVVQTSLQAIATGGFSASTCSYVDGRFYIQSGTTGGTSTISFASPVNPVSGTDISALMEVQQGLGTKSAGIDPETITQALDAIEEASSNWYGLIFTKEVRDGVQINGSDGVMDAATWTQGRVQSFFNTSNNLDVLDGVSSNDIVAQLDTANMTRTMSTFSSYIDQYPSASIAGRAFTVNYSQPNSAITLKFKQLPGITVEQLTSAQKNVLDNKRGNAFIEVGTTNIYAESYMAGDNFFDEVQGIDWLTDAIQVAVYGYILSRTTKVPYTDAGIAGLEQQLIRVLEEGVRNGLLAPGYTIDGEFLPRGYKTITVPVADVSTADKQNRVYGGLSFIAIGSGAIHRIQIQGVLER